MPNYTGGMSICPFYQRESRLSIVCEGYCQEQQIGMKFRTEAEKLQWQQKYCMRCCGTTRIRRTPPHSVRFQAARNLGVRNNLVPA